MAHTTGSKSTGRCSMLIARTPEIICAHCQSKCDEVGNLFSIALFVLLGSMSIHNPNIRPQPGLMRRFQKIGTASSGGFIQLRSVLRGENRTLPPAANFALASSQEFVTNTSLIRESGHR